MLIKKKNTRVKKGQASQISVNSSADAKRKKKNK